MTESVNSRSVVWNIVQFELKMCVSFSYLNWHNKIFMTELLEDVGLILDKYHNHLW